MLNEKRPNTLVSYNFSSKKSEFDVYSIKIISFRFFVLIKNLISFFYMFLLRYQYFVGPKKFWPINKNLAHRFFSVQEKFTHWYKNPGYVTVLIYPTKKQVAKKSECSSCMSRSLLCIDVLHSKSRYGNKIIYSFQQEQNFCHALNNYYRFISHFHYSIQTIDQIFYTQNIFYLYIYLSKSKYFKCC